MYLWIYILIIYFVNKYNIYMIYSFIRHHDVHLNCCGNSHSYCKHTIHVPPPKTRNYNPKHTERLYQDFNRRKTKFQQKKELFKIKKTEKELEECTFYPKTVKHYNNNFSSKIGSNRYLFPHKSTKNRYIYTKTSEEREFDRHCTFTPKLCAKTDKWLKKKKPLIRSKIGLKTHMGVRPKTPNSYYKIHQLSRNDIKNDFSFDCNDDNDPSEGYYTP